MRRLPAPVFVLLPLAALAAIFFLVQAGPDPSPEEASLKSCLAPDAIRALLTAGLDGKAISQVWDADDCPDLKVLLSWTRYRGVGPILERTLAAADIAILGKEEYRSAGDPFFRWRLQGPSGNRIDISFAIAALPSAAVQPPPRAKGPIAAIIIDDLGYSVEAVDALGALKRPVTAAILPFTPKTEEAVRRASDLGLETMLHLPLESLGAKEGWRSAVDGTIFTGMSAANIRQKVEECLDQIPGCRGVNNHTGSKFTEEADVVGTILDVLKDRGLYFIDSRTSGRSVAYEEAVRKGVPAAARRVFIDADPGDEGIRRRLIELFTAAKERGKAVGICHPRKQTLESLARHLGLAEAMGVTLVFASAIVD